MNTVQTNVWRDRLSSPLTWHIAGFAILVVLVIVLAVRFALDWSATSARSTDEVLQKQVELKAMEVQTAPLRGLDKRVVLSRDQIKHFLDTRIPENYSSIATRVGELEVKSGVRLTRLQYTQGIPEKNLTEIKLDAGLSGEYPQIMRFINSLERDKTFFVIKNMGLTGQQGGMVNLRLQVSTWLRPEAAAASGLPQAGQQNTTPQGGGQQP